MMISQTYDTAEGLEVRRRLFKSHPSSSKSSRISVFPVSAAPRVAASGTLCRSLAKRENPQLTRYSSKDLCPFLAASQRGEDNLGEDVTWKSFKLVTSPGHSSRRFFTSAWDPLAQRCRNRL